MIAHQQKMHFVKMSGHLIFICILQTFKAKLISPT
jgi:hypothetical protein